LNPYLVAGASTPTSVPSDVVIELVRESEKIAEILSLCDGIFHVQFIYNGKRAVIIEICRRPPGDLYVNLVKYATGLDYPMCLVKFAAGFDCSDIVQKEPGGYYLRHCIMGNRAGLVRDVEYSNEIKDKIIDQMLWWKPEDEVSDVFSHKHGIVFLKFNSKKEMLDYSSEMQSLIKVVVNG